MNCVSSLAKSFFEFAHWQFYVIRSKTNKVIPVSHRSNDFIEIMLIVRSDQERTARLERALNRIEKIQGDDSAPVVTSFRPWIGKEQIKMRDRTGWQEVTDGVGTFDI